MALSSQSSRLALCFCFCFLVLLSFIHAAVGARAVPASSGKNESAHAAPASSDKKEKDCIQEGTPGTGLELPPLSGFDHSGPAAAHGQYIPGTDDTFVPNPGFEVPNPARGIVP